MGTDVDPVAVRCARRNGVEVREGDLFQPLPGELAGHVDVVTAVAPYVPTSALGLLPPDTLAHEPSGALDGGQDGLAVIRRIAAEAPRWLRPGGWLVLELGLDQATAVATLLSSAGWQEVSPVVDPDGDACGIAVRWGANQPAGERRQPSVTTGTDDRH